MPKAVTNSMGVVNPGVPVTPTYATQPMTGGVSPMQTVPVSGNWTQTATAWNGVNVTPANPTVPAMSYPDPMGVSGVPTVEPDRNLDTEALKKMIRQSLTLYDSGVHNKKPISADVDALRSRLLNETFDPNNSKELRNIFGYIVGDMFNSLLDAKRYDDYDEIVDLLLASFPALKSTESKYAGTGNGRGKSLTKGNPDYYDQLAKDIRVFEIENGIDESFSEAKFNQTFSQFKLANISRKSELDMVRVNTARKAYVKKYKK